MLEGYAVDIACLRKYPRGEMAERASRHSRRCAMMGHCLESGFGPVEDDGRVLVLDAKATPQVFHLLESCGIEAGIRPRVVREDAQGEMETTRVELVT